MSSSKKSPTSRLEKLAERLESHTAELNQSVVAIELASKLHNSVMDNHVCGDEHYAMVWASAFVQELVDEGWKFIRE